jgi:hypothetical protein
VPKQADDITLRQQRKLERRDMREKHKKEKGRTGRKEGKATVGIQQQQQAVSHQSYEGDQSVAVAARFAAAISARSERPDQQSARQEVEVMIGNDRRNRHKVRSYAIVSALAVVTLLMGGRSETQASWCAAYRTGSNNCDFASFAQCQAAVSGVGGFCNEIRDGKSEARSPREERQRKVAKPTKEPEPKTQAKPRQVEPAPAVAAPVMSPGPAKPEPAQGAAPAAQSGAAFVQARDLILNGQYDAGIAAMRALKFDDHPDVATFIGLAYRKLGRIDEAKSWYQRALATDPNHKLALSYDGMMRVEQGDILGAQANLIRIGRLCGDINCNEYQALQGVIAARIR